MKKLSVCAMLLVAAVGCGKSETSTDPNASNGSATSGGMQNNVAQANGTAQPLVTNGVGTEPGEVVAVFLDSLRRGDENAANAVLTTQAQTELAKTDFVIQPLGTPEGSYKIGRVGFPDPADKTVALVECLWTEPNPEAGKPPVELDIVCEVRQEQPGWRISGLAVTMSGTEDTLVLDFEDAASLQQALHQAGGQPNQPQTQLPGSGQVAAQPIPGQPMVSQPLPGQGAPGQAIPGQPTSFPNQTAPNQGFAPLPGGMPPAGGAPQVALPGSGNMAPAGNFNAPNMPNNGFQPALPGQGTPNTQIALPPPGMIPGQPPVNR